MFSRFCMRTRPHRSGEESRKMPKLVRSGPGYCGPVTNREIGIKRERCGPLEPPVVIREGQDVASAAALATKCTHRGRFVKLGQVDKDRDNFRTPRRRGQFLRFLGDRPGILHGCRFGSAESAGALAGLDRDWHPAVFVRADRRAQSRRGRSRDVVPGELGRRYPKRQPGHPVQRGAESCA